MASEGALLLEVRCKDGGGKMRLIDADKLLNDYEELADCDFIHPLYENTLRDIIDDAPTVEVCEDCISREDVMKCFKKWQPYMATRLWDYEQELKELPSVTPQPTFYPPCYDCNAKMDEIRMAYDRCRWISASEKVPDYGQEVLLFDKNFGYVVGTYEMVDYFGVAEPSFLIHKSIDSLEKASIDPIAWMPLPQAYKAESEEDE